MFLLFAIVSFIIDLVILWPFPTTEAFYPLIYPYSLWQSFNFDITLYGTSFEDQFLYCRAIALAFVVANAVASFLFEIVLRLILKLVFAFIANKPTYLMYSKLAATIPSLRAKKQQ